MLPSSFLLTKQRCSRVCSLAVGDFNTSLPSVITKISHLSAYTGKKKLHCCSIACCVITAVMTHFQASGLLTAWLCRGLCWMVQSQKYPPKWYILFLLQGNIGTKGPKERCPIGFAKQSLGSLPFPHQGLNPPSDFWSNLWELIIWGKGLLFDFCLGRGNQLQIPLLCSTLWKEELYAEAKKFSCAYKGDEGWVWGKHLHVH